MKKEIKVYHCECDVDEDGIGHICEPQIVEVDVPKAPLRYEICDAKDDGSHMIGWGHVYCPYCFEHYGW